LLVRCMWQPLHHKFIFVVFMVVRSDSLCHVLDLTLVVHRQFGASSFLSNSYNTS
jgi:hypothetical protein